MYNYRDGKKRYVPNSLGSLYINESKINDNERPIIYIGGQMEHRCHVLEQTGITFDPGHNLFTGNWFYDYSVFSRHKSNINGENLAKNLELSLKQANLCDVDLITHSFGGIIAALASKNDRIHAIYAIHPPITGTPLANPKIIEKYNSLLNKSELFLLQLLKIVVNTEYGFENDSYTGVDFRKVDLNKLVVIGSNLDPEKEEGIPLGLYNIIKKTSDMENDGVVIFDESTFNNLGINYIKEDKNINHFDSGNEESLYSAYQLSRKKL